MSHSAGKHGNLMADRRYWPLFWTQFLGAFNDNFFKNALVILITYKAYSIGVLNSEQMVALCGGIFILPFFLFSALAGQLADKYPKQKIVTAVKVAEIVIMVIAAIGFMTEHLVLLLVTLFLMGLHSTIFGPVKYSALPEILNEDELVAGNAYIESGTFLAILMGTLIGGMTITIPGSGTMITGIGIIITAILGTWTSFKMNELEPVNPNLKIEKDIFKPTVEIIRLTRKTKSVFLSILGISWFWFVGAIFLSVLPPFCKNVLHGSEHVVTMFLAIFSIGVGLGAVLCEKLSFGQLELGLVPIGSIGMSIFLADLFFSSRGFSLTATTPMIFLTTGEGLRIIFDMLSFSIFSGFFTVPLYTFIQSRSDRETRSQVIAGNNILNSLFMVVASVMLMGLYAMKMSIPQIFLLLAFLNGLAAVYIYTVVPEFMYRFVLWCLTNICYRLKIVNRDRIPVSGPAVLVCNHVSWVDWMILASITPRPIKFVMHYSFMKIPVAGKFFKDGKVIPIAGMKEDPEIMENAFKEIKRYLDEGELVCIFPEGAITENGELGVFKHGIERIIKETPVAIIPLSLNGMWGSFFSRKSGKAMTKPFKRIWSNISVVVGDVIRPQELNVEELRNKVKNLGE
ncbi:MAG: MFS transporter [Bacteriovoracaceae bacterium]